VHRQEEGSRRHEAGGRKQEARGRRIQRLAKVFTLLGISFLFCCITTCNLNRCLFGFHVMDRHKTVQIGEVKLIKELVSKNYCLFHPPKKIFLQSGRHVV
jgi:hypothetical protein